MMRNFSEICKSIDDAIILKDWQTAVQESSICCENFPDIEDGYSKGLLAARNLGDYGLADRYVKAAIKQFGNKLHFLVSYADNAMDSKNWQLALGRWSEVIRSYPDFEHGYNRALLAINAIRFPAVPAVPAISNDLTFYLLSRISQKIAKKRRICFVSHAGFNGHNKYVYLYLFENKELFNLDVCWLTIHSEEVLLLNEKGFDVLLLDDTPKTADYLLQTDIAIYTTTEPFYPYQACLDGAIRIQLWHGIPAKEVGYNSALNWSNFNDFAYFSYQTILCDFVIAESENVKNAYEFAFPKANIIALGSCRSDILVDENNLEEHHLIGLDSSNIIKIEEFKKAGLEIILYAPTYRESNQNIDLFLLELMKLISLFEKKDDAILVIKPHSCFVPVTNIEIEIFNNLNSKVIFIESWEDIYPYLKLSDTLITDYSSVYYDFLVTNRGIVFLQPDQEEYITNRSIQYYEIEQNIKAGPSIKYVHDLIDAIELTDSAEYKENRKLLADYFHLSPYSGNTTEKVGNFIHSLIRV